MEKKMTYAQALVNAIAVVEDKETVERLTDLKASLEKKALSKRKTVDNTGYFDKVREVLGSGTKTPTEMVTLINVSNTQKVASIVKAMGDEVVIERKGKKVLYKLAN